MGGCLVLAGGFGVESEPTLRILSLPSSPASNRWRCREMHRTEWPRLKEGQPHHAHPQPPTPRGPFTFAFPPGSSSHRYKPCRAVCEQCPPCHRKVRKGRSRVRTGQPWATRQNDRAPRGDTRVLLVPEMVDQPVG